MHTGGGHDQVTDAGQTGKGVDIAAHGHAQPGKLGNAAGDEGGTGVVAIAQAGGDAHAQRDDILHGTAEFHTLDVLIGVHTHDVVGEHRLHESGRFHILAGRNDGGGQVDCHLLSVGGAAQGHQTHPLGAALFAQLIGQDLRHGEQGILFNALGNVHNDLTVRHKGPGLGCGGAHEHRRHREQQDLLVRAHLFHALGELHLCRNGHAGQIGVDPGGGKVVDLLFQRRPHGHVIAAHRQHPRQSHAPGACTQNTNFMLHCVLSSVCAGLLVCPACSPRFLHGACLIPFYTKHRTASTPCQSAQS